MSAFVVGFNEWVLKAFVEDQAWRRTKSKTPAAGSMTARSFGS
jgi:hypothetical protein